MNSRERMLTTLDHQEPDQIPFDLGGTQQSGIHIQAYRKLRHYLGLPEIEPQVQTLVKDHVRRNIEAFAPGGGFVFAAVHIVQADVLPENFMAMWETLQEYGNYH